MEANVHVGAEWTLASPVEVGDSLGPMLVVWDIDFDQRMPSILGIYRFLFRYLGDTSHSAALRTSIGMGRFRNDYRRRRRQLWIKDALRGFLGG